MVGSAVIGSSAGSYTSTGVHFPSASTAVASIFMLVCRHLPPFSGTATWL
jgi:hypothetical protein